MTPATFPATLAAPGIRACYRRAILAHAIDGSGIRGTFNPRTALFDSDGRAADSVRRMHIFAVAAWIDAGRPDCDAPGRGDWRRFRHLADVEARTASLFNRDHAA